MIISCKIKLVILTQLQPTHINSRDEGGCETKLIWSCLNNGEMEKGYLSSWVYMTEAACSKSLKCFHLVTQCHAMGNSTEGS